MKEREANDTNKLDIAEVSHITEFGHHPIQIFDRPHENFDSRICDFFILDAIFKELPVILQH